MGKKHFGHHADSHVGHQTVAMKKSLYNAEALTSLFWLWFHTDIYAISKLKNVKV